MIMSFGRTKNSSFLRIADYELKKTFSGMTSRWTKSTKNESAAFN